MPKFCQNCGEPISDGIKFCENCGAAISAPAPEVQQAAQPEPQQATQPQYQSTPQQAAQPQYQSTPQQAAQPQYQSTPQQAAQPQYQQPMQPQYQQPMQPQYQQPMQPQYQQPMQPQYQQPMQPQYQQPMQPQYQQPMQPQYQQPMQPQYQQPMQPQYQQPMQPQYQQPVPPMPQYQPMPQGAVAAPVPKKKKKTGLIALIVAILFAAAVIGGYFVIKGMNEKKGGKLDILHELTAHASEAYLSARMLTEQILQTDTVTSDPEEVNSLFDECLKTWDAIKKITDKIGIFAGDLDKQGEKLNAQYSVFSGFDIHAQAAEEDPVSEVQTASESVESCSLLGTQFGDDADAAYSLISDLRRIYDGRSTSQSDWMEAAGNISNSFSTTIFISGEMVGSDTTTGMSHSVHTLSRRVKSGTLAVSGVTTLVSVGENSSTIIMGSNDDGVLMDVSELGAYISEDSTTISISSETPNDTSRIIFHSTSISTWFILDKVGGFTIGRRDKGTGITQPEVESSFTNIDDNRPNPGQYEEELTIHIPEQIRRPIGGDGGWTNVPNTGNSTDIVNTTSEITGENNGGNNENSGNTSTTPTESTLNDGINSNGAGSGDITVSMNWGCADDLDLHIDTPDGSHIYYGRKEAGGGVLDVDANAGTIVDNPIENIYFARPDNGHYKVWIKNFRDRTSGAPAHYLVRVTVNGVSKIFEGTIDGTGTEIVIYEFDYNGGGSNTEPEVNSNTLSGILGDLNAGEGPITVSMLWNTQDDLDLHIITPDESHVYYGNKNAGGGVLDIDANSSGNMMDNPVENIYFAAPQSGHYKVYINDFNDRSSGSTHYLVRVKVGDNVQEFEGNIDTTGTDITIIEFDYGGGSDGRIPNDAVTFGESRFSYFPQQMTWIQARDFCASLGGHLATITSSAEQSFIESSFPGCQGWIGGFEGNNNQWYWVTGEEMSFTDWKSGEPNNQNDKEWCMHLYTGMKWNDLPVDDTTYHTGFICEWDRYSNIFNANDVVNRLNENGAGVGPITVSLAWSSMDDLDLHVFTPNGNDICFDEREHDGGVLDIDMIPNETNAQPPYVENVYFADPMNGEYYVYVYDYNDLTPDTATSYMLRLQIGDNVKTFEGSISGTDNYYEICGFQYTGGRDAGEEPDTYPDSEENYNNSGSAYANLSNVSWDGASSTLSFVLTFGGDLEDSAWIGIVPAGTANDENSADRADVAYQWLTNMTSGQSDKLVYDLADGSYELRVYPSDHDDDTQPICVYPFTVGSGSTANTSVNSGSSSSSEPLYAWVHVDTKVYQHENALYEYSSYTYTASEGHHNSVDKDWMYDPWERHSEATCSTPPDYDGG